MSDMLDALQKRLQVHFEALAEARSKRKLPVFALEHGLSTGELAEMAAKLHGKLRAGGYQLYKHWLVWVVYATEQGYDYDGDEYWHSFERRTPGWDRSWRPSLRTWFERFGTKYRGLRPTGTWASFFSIIAWPITHSLLPKDLQCQLARTLYSLRYNLVSQLDRTPAEIGRYVNSFSYGGSSRYENFLQQKELVGHLVLALLQHMPAEDAAAIHPAALERLVQDLEKAREARAWLKEARRAVEIARLKGTAPARQPSSRAQAGQSEPAEPRPSIRPTILLSRTAPDEWTPMLELPSFRQIAGISPEVAVFLSRTRCSVAGASGLRPPGWLLSGAQRRVIATWPDPLKPVISFQSPNAAVEHLLSSECRISPGPSWLFRIGSDGRALEIASRLVRPGKSYVLVQSGKATESPLAKPTTIRCAGVMAQRIEVPSALSESDVSVLRELGLSVAETIRIWPAGLAARGWDGEGTTEWLEGERPCFGIEHDHPVAAYEFRLGAGPVLTVPAKAPGEPTFVRLQPLPAGNHVLAVSVARVSGEAPTKPAEGLIVLSIRPPETWVSGSIGHAGLIATTEPHDPTLDAFWEGRTELKVMGPTGRQVAVSVELLNGTGSTLSVEQIANIALPMREDTWRNAYQLFANREKDPWAHLGATAGRIIVDGEELGTISLPLQRDVAPIRWVWHATSGRRQIRLVDDHDADTPLCVTYRSFVEPLQELAIEPSGALGGMELSAPGGLLTAARGDIRDALVVSMPQVEGGLAGLVPECKIYLPRRTEELAFEMVKAVVSWRRARLTGPLVADRRRHVLTRLGQCLAHLLCTPAWAAAERILEGGDRDHAQAAMVDCFPKFQRSFAVVLLRDAAKFWRMPPHVREREFAHRVQSYRVAPGRTVKPALDLVALLEEGDPPADDVIREMIHHLWDAPGLVAGARMIQLLGRLNQPRSGAAA